MVRQIGIGLAAVLSVASAFETPVYAPSPADILKPVHIGVQSQLPNFDKQSIQSSLARLREINQEHPVIVHELSKEQLRDAMGRNELDFAFADPFVAAAFERFQGARPLVSLQRQEAISPDKSSSAAVFVRSDSMIRRLENLGGKAVGFVKADGQLAKDMLEMEFRQQFGLNRAGAVRFVEASSLKALLSLLEQREVDAVVLPACSPIPDGVKLLEPRSLDGLSCPHTTPAYPGVLLLAMLNNDDQIADYFSALLKSLSQQSFLWRRLQRTSELHSLMESSEQPFYQSFKKESWITTLRHWSPYLLAIFAVLLGLLVHAWRTEKLIQRKTKELTEAHRQQQQTRQSIEALERTSIVGQMSSILAHEIKQPITAIHNYGSSLMRRSKRGNIPSEVLVEVLERIIQQTARAEEIVNHVRSYAKKKSTIRQWIDLGQTIDESVSRFKRSGRAHAEIRTRLDKDLMLEADPFEIELIVLNLLKNADEATREQASPLIELALDSYTITVSDNGPKLSEETLLAMAKPLHTSKAEGLGLGLPIVCRLVESYGGSVQFSARQPKGLVVSVNFPNPDKK